MNWSLFFNSAWLILLVSIRSRRFCYCFFKCRSVKFGISRKKIVRCFYRLVNCCGNQHFNHVNHYQINDKTDKIENILVNDSLIIFFLANPSYRHKQFPCYILCRSTENRPNRQTHNDITSISGL